MSDLPNGSASATDRTLACPAWLALPKVERPAAAVADRGHQAHGFIRNVLEGMAPAAALERVAQEHRRLCVLLDWRALGGDLVEIECESAYVIDVRARTARLLGFNVGRAYAKAAGGKLGPWEVPGSLDIAGRHRERPRTFVVIDTKTGFKDVTPAERNGQGLFFAAAILLSRDDVDEVEFRIARVKTTGDVWDRDRFTFTRLDVDLFLDELEAAIVRSRDARKLVVAGGTPDVAEGTWCDYCPAADHCPAKTRLVRAMLPELADIEARVGAMTIEQIGAAWEIAHDRVKPLLKRVEDALKERIHREGRVPLPDGQHDAKSIRYPQDRFSEKAAIALLEKLGATQAQIDACFTTGEVKKVQTVNATKPRKGRAA